MMRLEKGSVRVALPQAGTQAHAFESMSMCVAVHEYCEIGSGSSNDEKLR